MPNPAGRGMLVPGVPFSLWVLSALLLVVMPLGADANQDRSLVADTISNLLPRAAEPGFTELAISRARGMARIVDALDLLSELITRSPRTLDVRALYVERASYQELLGRYEDAAHSWEAAVAARPGQGETAWLLSAAACRLAVGDAEAASALAKAALLTTASRDLIARALLIEGRAMMLIDDTAGALARALDVLALGPSGYEAAALTLARDVSTGPERDGYAMRLRKDHPGRPETQDVLASLFSLVRSEAIQAFEAGVLVPEQGAAPVSSAAPTRQPGAGVSTATTPLFYQLGAFRDEANAALLSTRLTRAGFRPRTVRRETRTGQLSIVYLEAGDDPTRLMIALKDAGFESWPLFAEP